MVKLVNYLKLCLMFGSYTIICFPEKYSPVFSDSLPNRARSEKEETQGTWSTTTRDAPHCLAVKLDARTPSVLR